MSRKDLIVTRGIVSEALGSDRFRVTLGNGAVILCTISGRMRLKHIRVMAGDSVEVEMSPYDMGRGRISFRYKQGL